MADTGVRFIRRDGRVIPIRAAAGAGRVAASHVVGRAVTTSAVVAGHAIRSKISPAKPHTGKLKVNEGLNMLGLGASVASGALAAATTFSSGKVALAGLVGSFGLDAVSTSANLASVRGGTFGQRAKQIAKQQAVNEVVGYGVWGAGLLGFESNRRKGAAIAIKGWRKTKRILGV